MILSTRIDLEGSDYLVFHLNPAIKRHVVYGNVMGREFDSFNSGTADEAILALRPYSDNDDVRTLIRWLNCG